MNAVIYARYSSDNQREESIEGNSANVWSLQIILALQLSAIISTVRSRQKRTTVPNFKK